MIAWNKGITMPRTVGRIEDMLFIQRTSENNSANAVAKRMGVTPRSIYRYRAIAKKKVVP